MGNTAEGTEKYVTLADLASHCGVSLWAVRKWLKEGMPHQRLGARTVRVRLGEVRDWLAQREQQAVALAQKDVDPDNDDAPDAAGRIEAARTTSDIRTIECACGRRCGRAVAREYSVSQCLDLGVDPEDATAVRRLLAEIRGDCQACEEQRVWEVGCQRQTAADLRKLKKTLSNSDMPFLIREERVNYIEWCLKNRVHA